MYYLQTGIITLALLAAQHPNWNIIPIATNYTYANGKTVYVAEGRYLDSLELTGWSDVLVQYPINLNDSNKVHKVLLNSNDFPR